MEKDSQKHIDQSHLLKKIIQSKYGNHNLILYSDISTLAYIYSNYSKSSLESLNEIILILPYYHSIADVLNNLTNNGVDIDKHKKEGSIVIVESKKAYYSLTDEFVGLMIMTKMLLRRANKIGKAGVTIFSDMGVFFDLNRVHDLIKYETELLSSICDMKVKVLCGYTKTDFERFIEYQRQHLLNLHNNTIILT
jgi:hypothetical protein